jgi:hypothetical protein
MVFAPSPIAFPKNIDELNALDRSDRVLVKHALALCLKPDNIDDGLCEVGRIFAAERARIMQRKVSAVLFLVLTLVVGGVLANKALTGVYWSIAVFGGFCWVLKAVSLFKSIRSEHRSRFGELAFSDPTLSAENQPFIEAGVFQGYLSNLEEEALSPWAILGDFSTLYPPAIRRKR